jgi:transposase
VQQALVSGAASFAAGELNKISLPPVLTEVAKSLPPETTRVASAIINRPELVNLATSEIAKRLGTNEATVQAASKAVQTAKTSDAMAALAKLTPQQQKDLVAYTALSKLSPEQQKQLVEFTKKKPITVHETATPAKKPITVHEPAAPSKPAVAARAGVYPPYPKKMSGTVSAPPHHPIPHHHGGRPGAPHVFRGGRGGPGWWWDAPSVIVTQAESCRTWGDPVAMSVAMQTAAKAALGASGGRPTVARAPDGVLYLFSFETGGGLSARPCAA